MSDIFKRCQELIDSKSGVVIELKFVDGVSRTIFFLLAFSMTRRETVTLTLCTVAGRVSLAGHCTLWNIGSQMKCSTIWSTKTGPRRFAMIIALIRPMLQDYSHYQILLTWESFPLWSGHSPQYRQSTQLAAGQHMARTDHTQTPDTGPFNSF